MKRKKLTEEQSARGFILFVGAGAAFGVALVAWFTWWGLAHPQMVFLPLFLAYMIFAAFIFGGILVAAVISIFRIKRFLKTV